MKHSKKNLQVNDVVSDWTNMLSPDSCVHAFWCFPRPILAHCIYSDNYKIYMHGNYMPQRYTTGVLYLQLTYMSHCFIVVKPRGQGLHTRMHCIYELDTVLSVSTM